MEDDKYKINNLLAPLFANLTKFFEEFSKDTLTDKDLDRMYALILKATIVKSYEFNLSILNSKNDAIYFMLPTLRGICEEYIIERFLFEELTDKDERNFLVMIWQQYGLLKSSVAQWEYYKVNKPNQKLYYEDSFPEKISNMEIEIKKHFKRKFPSSNFKSVFPSVYYMAKKVGLLELYNYLYHATSTFVHFHPQNLFRMSWGNMPNMRFSTSNFKHYYNDFIIYYSTQLFCSICEWQIKKGYLDGIDQNGITSIKEILGKINRQPEIVTFEEMNIGTLARIFYKSPDESP